MEVFLDELRQVRRSIEPQFKMVLFGSRARYDYSEASDWDLLLIVESAGSFSKDFVKYGMPLIECGIRNNEEVNVHIYSRQEWESYKEKSLLYYNVSKEGIEI